MPPKGERLTADEVALLCKWIDAGAKGSAAEVVSGPVKSTHWSFQPVVRPAEPAVKNTALAAKRHRPLHPRPAGEGRDFALSRGRPDYPPPPAVPRSDRHSPHARGSGRVPARSDAGRLRAGRSSAAGVARTMGSAGAGTGSTWPATPTPTATASTRRARSGSIATGLSTPSTPTCPSIASRSSNWPATCLPKPTAQQKIATGFHRNTQINEEGGIDKEQFRVEAVVDRDEHHRRSVFLGLTVGCCPVPRPQVRSHFAEGVLSALRLLQQRRRRRSWR